MNAQLPMFHRIGAAAYKANLDNTIALCARAWKPFRTISDVSDILQETNGKGSALPYAAPQIFTAKGYPVQVCTHSPHLKDFRERIRVNGKKISEAYVPAFHLKALGGILKR